MPTRRDLLIAGGSCLLAGAQLGAARGEGAGLGPNRLVLLGTKGGPSIPLGYAASPSASLIVHDNVPYLIDTGYGVSFKLVQAKIPLPALRYVFITHHHSDHNAEFGLLLYNAWAMGLRGTVDAYGPAGLAQLANGFWDAYRFDIDTRIVDEGRPDLRKLIVVHEYSDGPVMTAGEVKVTALRNVHPPITDSFALKFEFPGKTVVFSGDTAYHPPLAAFARGADVLVHEVMYGPALDELVRRIPNAATLMSHLKASHTLAADVGRIATEAGVKKLVLNHLVPVPFTGMSEQVWIDAVRPTYQGDLVVGRDLLEIAL
ncbi:MAG TPA: MBL fold metallo-hydrolase [Xanthobacteraceae bacterium]|jgi:ribonuclease BN (tRNA processing enzyme)